MYTDATYEYSEYRLIFTFSNISYKKSYTLIYIFINMSIITVHISN